MTVTDAIKNYVIRWWSCSHSSSRSSTLAGGVTNSLYVTS